MTVGEAQNPRRVIPRAIKLTFYRILVFYVLSVLLVGMNVPYNSPKLAFANKATTGASASPFVVAIELAGIRGLPGFLNACIILFVFSAANSDLYIATRTIYGLSVEGKAPRFLSRTNAAGVPVYALGASAAFACLAYLNVKDDSKLIFGYFVNLVSGFGLLCWISILVSHICFVRARRAQGIPTTALAYVAPLGQWGSSVALGFCILIALTKNFAVFTCDPKTHVCFDYKNFVTGYLNIPVYLALVLGYKVVMRSKRILPATADFFTGKDVIDREEAEFLAEEKAKKAAGGDRAGWVYRTFVAWLF